MNKTKCTCPSDYDCCICGYEKVPKKVTGIRQIAQSTYCHNCLSDGVLVRLVLKPVYDGSRRAPFCKRCSKETGAGYYGSGGYTATQAREKLLKVLRRVEKVIESATDSLKELDKSS